jgi:hypothetical protein
MERGGRRMSRLLSARPGVVVGFGELIDYSATHINLTIHKYFFSTRFNAHPSRQL